MHKISDLKGKKFEHIEDSEFGNIKITFQDGTIAYFDIVAYPDDSVRSIELDRIIKKRDRK